MQVLCAPGFELADRRAVAGNAAVLHRLVRAFVKHGLEVDEDTVEALASFVLAWPKATS